MPDDADPIMPFSTGSQRMGWTAANCWRCRKGDVYDPVTETYTALSTCPIMTAIEAACNGEEAMTPEMARRMGLLDAQDAYVNAYVWRCGEFDPTDEAAVELGYESAEHYRVATASNRCPHCGARFSATVLADGHINTVICPDCAERQGRPVVRDLRAYWIGGS